MAASDNEFESLLTGFSRDDLEKHHDAIYGLWPDYRIAYVNPAWHRFAAENGGEPAIGTRWSYGACILDAMSEVLVSFYESAYRRCLDTGERWEHQYECSSSVLHRRFQQIVYPLKREGLLVVNSLVVEQRHDGEDRKPRKPLEHQYRDENGLITQCAHCRRVENVHVKDRWDWIPEWVERFPAETSHSFCPTCLAFYYTARYPG